MKEIKLTQAKISKGKVALVDDADFDWLSHYNWNVIEVYRGRFYAVRDSSLGINAFMHRVIMDATPGLTVDHIDGNGLNNQRSNLRLCTASQNQSNRAKPKWKSGCSSGFKGVHWYPSQRKWECQICANGRRVHLGYFEDPREAAAAYNEAAKRLHGEFAFQNVL